MNFLLYIVYSGTQKVAHWVWGMLPPHTHTTNGTDSFYFSPKKNNSWLLCLTVIKYGINIIFERKILTSIIQVKIKTSKYTAVTYATHVTYSTFFFLLNDFYYHYFFTRHLICSPQPKLLQCMLLLSKRFKI